MKASDSTEKIAQELLEQLKGRDLLFPEAIEVAKVQHKGTVTKMPVCTTNARPTNATASIVFYAVDNAAGMKNRRFWDAQRTHYSP